MVLRASLQKREEKERVRHALLRAALQLGSEHGFSSLGLREVSRAAAIAPTSFYRHFTDMPELGLALVHELVRPLLQTLTSEPVTANTPHATLVERMFEAVEQDAELVRFVVAERFGSFASLRKALAEELERVVLALHWADTGADRATHAPHLLETGMALLLDGLGRILDASGNDRAVLCETLIRAYAPLVHHAQTEQRRA
jgi:AcrR family transcriptional regulator